MIANAFPRKVFVDLSPLAADGSNGGALPFVLGLLQGLLKGEGLELHLLVKPEAVSLVVPLRERGARLLFLGSELSEPRRLLRTRRRLPTSARVALDTLWPDRTSLKRLGAEVLFSPLQTATFHEPGLFHVAIAYDFQELEHLEFFDETERRRRAAFRADLARADRVAAISEFTRHVGIERVGLRPERLTVIPPVTAIRTPLSEETLRNALERLQLPRGAYAVYPANFWPHKNHERLLKAVAGSSLREDPTFVLVLCGALHHQRHKIEELVSALGLEEKVRVLPYLSEPDVTAAIQGARFLAFPSLYEGFGIPVLEAFGLGTPVACSDIPALEELAGDAALLFDPNDLDAIAEAMTTLWTRSETRAALTLAGGSRVADISPATTASAFRKLLLPGHPGPHDPKPSVL